MRHTVVDKQRDEIVKQLLPLADVRRMLFILSHLRQIELEIDMFTLAELKAIHAALTVQEKSVNRLAAKDGQPESVAAEYRKVAGEIVQVVRKVLSEIDKITVKK